MGLDFQKYQVGEPFKSRKNRVFRIRTDSRIQVAKVYPISSSDAARAEFQLLNKCVESHLTVPKPHELADSTIVMAYVDGSNVADLVDRLLSGERPTHRKDDVTFHSLARGLAEWLASFHRAFECKLCRGDTILRNFLLSKDTIFGLDFEEAHEGDPILDLGELCANVLGMRPLFSSLNFEFASDIVNGYWDATGKNRSEDISESIAIGLEHYAKFREDGGILQGWAQRFRNEGAVLLEQSVSKI